MKELLKKHKRKIRNITICILIGYILFYGLTLSGIISPSKRQMLDYFEKNFDDFVLIAEYLENMEQKYLLLREYPVLNNKRPELLGAIQNKEIEEKIKVLLADKLFDGIRKYSDDKGIEVSFLVPNLSIDDGESIAIVYCDYEPEDDYSDHYEYLDYVRVYAYEKIKENWYYYKCGH